MKNLLVLSLFAVLSVQAIAQPNTDSTAYQAERKKINSMLAIRSQKFGEYDQSLGKHTGIFGLQTKKDIRRSNDILMDIVTTDDAIFKELKVLLDYRAFEQTQVQTQTVQVQQNALGYMATINKLRSQVDILKAAAAKTQEQQAETRRWLIILIIVLTASILLLFIRKPARRI